jgi:hypothetical protein
VDIKILGAGEMVGAWALHAGDRIAMPDGEHGSFAAIVTAIRDTPAPLTGGGDHELDWEALDHHSTGHLHYSPADLVNRLYANKSVAA